MKDNNFFTLEENANSIPFLEYATSDLLYRNIKNIQQSSIYLEPMNLICDDKRCLKINLHKTELQNKHIGCIKFKFVSKKINDNPIFTQEYINSNLMNIRYNLLCGYNIIYDDDFYQDTNLLTQGLILPLKCIKDHHSICINIMNISNMLSLLNYIDLQILYDEIEFEEDFDISITELQIDQLIKTKNNTYNVFRVMWGMGAKAIDIELPKDEFNEIAHKINYKILV